MKIVVNTTSKLFQDIEVGAFFMYENGIFFKRMDNLAIVIRPIPNTKMAISTGNSSKFDPKDPVRPINKVTFDIGE